MSIRLKTLILVLVMGLGAFGGAPLNGADAGGTKKLCPMKCCKKKAASQAPESKASKNFCRVISCSEMVPSAPGTANASTAAPAFLNKAESFNFYFAVSAKPRAPGKVSVESTTKLSKSVPAYVFHGSLLI